MKRLLIVFFLFITDHSFTQEFQLAPPALTYKSVFFSAATTFSVLFNQPGTTVHYTLNGKEPTENDLIYKRPVAINKRTIVKVKAMGKDYLASETISAEFIRNGKPLKSVGFTKPGESYANVKADILNDNNGGIPDYRNGEWVGYDRDTVEIDIELKRKEKIGSVLIDLLQDENSWIFLPGKIELYYFDPEKDGYLLTGAQIFSSDKFSPKRNVLQEIKPGKKIIAGKLKLVLFTLKNIPDWHAGKGKHGWLFIDEIKVY
jgi:hypothetical protein